MEIRKVNQTYLIFIPKMEKLKFATQFKLEYLCNVLYKLVTKILMNKIILPNITSPNQRSFVPRRHITDNIIVTQEIIHAIRTY